MDKENKVELANPGSSGKWSLKQEEVGMEVVVALPLLVGQLEDIWTMKHLNSNYPPYVVFWETLAQSLETPEKEAG